MQTAQIIQRGNNYIVQHGTDAGMYVQFYMESIEDKEASEKEGRPIFRDYEFIKIIPPGDKNTVICEPVNEEYKMRWPNQYAAFKNQQVQVNDGTPLEEWPILRTSQVKMFKAVNVHTVEQLAAVSDQNLPNLGMGAREFRDKAITYLESAKTGAVPMAAQSRIQELEREIEALKNQMAGFKTDMAQDEPKRRGRPPKTIEE
jgi:hypothetical protein